MLFIRTLLQMVLAMLLVSSATAQTVRFETSFGNFDIELFPDKAPLNVANFLQYVTSGRYDNTVINRADGDGVSNFVIQMGSFASPTQAPPTDPSAFERIIQYPPVIGEPAATVGLSHTIGTVGFALVGGLGNVQKDSGTSSFFINGGNNTQLDAEFTVFGAIVDMSVPDLIFSAIKVQAGHPLYRPADIRYSKIPLQANGDLVFINAAYVIPEPTSWMLLGCGILLCAGRHRR